MFIGNGVAPYRHPSPSGKARTRSPSNPEQFSGSAEQTSCHESAAGCRGRAGGGGSAPGSESWQVVATPAAAATQSQCQEVPALGPALAPA